MRSLSYSSKEFDSELKAFCRGATVPEQIAHSVQTILGDVRKHGDAALLRYARRFDGAKLTARTLRVSPSEIQKALRSAKAPALKALKAAHNAVRDFNRRTLPKAWSATNVHGARVGEKYDPIRRVGLYVPGGEVPLVSTVIMTATLAKIAGCPEIAAFTPSNSKGEVSADLLAALAVAGVSEVYRVGGVHAIGAMAYGTASITAVDKIFGPGNAYVCEAKRQVFGTVGVDLLPGPSELMVIADESANVAFAAADLLAQAEHGSGREKIYLVATSDRVIKAIESEIARQLPALTRSEKTRRVLEDGFLAVCVRSLGQAADVANRVAPEHLELLVRKSGCRALTKAITTAGAIFIGNLTPTALGDFAAGPSHVLPTAGAGRFSSGLRVEDFLRRTSLVEYDARSLAKAEPVVAAFAAMERLDAHGHSASVRVAHSRR